jgi:hypothetical protein
MWEPASTVQILKVALLRPSGKMLLNSPSGDNEKKGGPQAAEQRMTSETILPTVAGARYIIP